MKFNPVIEITTQSREIIGIDVDNIGYLKNTGFGTTIFIKGGDEIETFIETKANNFNWAEILPGYTLKEYEKAKKEEMNEENT